MTVSTTAVVVGGHPPVIAAEIGDDALHCGAPPPGVVGLKLPRDRGIEQDLAPSKRSPCSRLNSRLLSRLQVRNQRANDRYDSFAHRARLPERFDVILVSKTAAPLRKRSSIYAEVDAVRLHSRASVALEPIWRSQAHRRHRKRLCVFRIHLHRESDNHYRKRDRNFRVPAGVTLGIPCSTSRIRELKSGSTRSTSMKRCADRQAKLNARFCAGMPSLRITAVSRMFHLSGSAALRRRDGKPE